MRKANAEWIKSYAEASRDDFYPDFQVADALEEIADKFKASARDEAQKMVEEILTEVLGDIFLMEGLTAEGHLSVSVCAGDDYRVDFDLEEEFTSSLNGMDWLKGDCLALAASLRRIADIAEKAAETAPDV